MSAPPKRPHAEREPQDCADEQPPLVAWVMDAAPGEPLDEPIPYVLVEVAP